MKNENPSAIPRGKLVSKETREKLSLAQKKRIENGTYKTPFVKGMKGLRCGIPCSEKTKEKLRECNIGKHHTEVTKEKCRMAAISAGAGFWSKGRIVPKEQRKKQSNALAGKLPANILRAGKYGNVKRGWFNISGRRMFFRSKWEANYALYLDFLLRHNEIKKWEYESESFFFEKIRFGTRSYRPDFKITNKDNTIEYHEIKGWMDKKSATKLKRMCIYFPTIKIRLLRAKEIANIKKQLGTVLQWF